MSNINEIKEKAESEIIEILRRVESELMNCGACVSLLSIDVDFQCTTSVEKNTADYKITVVNLDICR